MTRLSQLEERVAGACRSGDDDPDVSGIAYDSRRVKPGDLFVCIRGFSSDGLEFLPEAIRRGATAALVERDAVRRGTPPIPTLLVPSARAGMAQVAAAFYGYPSRQLRVVGVTGTNGKTTTSYLAESILRAAGHRTGVVGTIGTLLGGEWLPADRTTPEAPDLQAVLREMLDRGIESVAMEASSHALVLERTLGCEFDAAVFTNLTQDHLDFHADMEDYFQAKAILFSEYPRLSAKPFAGVINRDDPYGRRLALLCAGTARTFGIEEGADFQARQIRASANSLEYVVAGEGEEHPIRMPLGGHFNVHNSLGAIGACRALGVDWEFIRSGLAAATGVPGRFESVAEGQPFSVIVDYAHTPDGLENVLRSARALEPARLTVVFGCGGDRDRRKRPLMGAIGARLADRVVLTSDNPRSEDPEAILSEIAAGIGEDQMDRVRIEPDRRTAIRTAIHGAAPGEMVIIAGKGHETYQIFASETIAFDDREVAREAILETRGKQGVPSV